MSVSSSAAYQPPTWAVKPTGAKTWRLVEIKTGVQIDKATTVLGRAADQVDITLAHASCSRRHARISFANTTAGTGTIQQPWLRDLGSAHGTSVNKVKLPATACGKLEDNANTFKKGSRITIGFQRKKIMK